MVATVRPVSVRFEEETAITPVGDDRYGCRFSRDWYVNAGPNGGVVAAVMLRACTAAVADAHRSPRSLTVHYLRPPSEGPAEVRATVERAGRGITFLSARLTQDGRLAAIAQAAYGSPRSEHVAWSARPMPALPPPAACPRVQVEGAPRTATIRDRWDDRWALGAENERWALDDRAVAGPTEGSLSGGWIRASTPTAVDHHLVAAVADAWLPPVIARPGVPPLMVPTVELTIHFRDTIALVEMDPEDFFACAFRTDVAQEGFLEEDGLIWSPQGRLVAMSRQLAVVSLRPEEPR